MKYWVRDGCEGGRNVQHRAFNTDPSKCPIWLLQGGCQRPAQRRFSRVPNGDGTAFQPLVRARVMG